MNNGSDAVLRLWTLVFFVVMVCLVVLVRLSPVPHPVQPPNLSPQQLAEKGYFHLDEGYYRIKYEQDGNAKVTTLEPYMKENK